jgi:3-deoxy-manno-octulosonate cytidylyltransferase (CMP-KDO synthetase)
MVQGDEPMIFPEMIDESLAPIINNSSINVVNLLRTIDNTDDFNNSNEIRVVIDKELNALYFSREPISSSKKYSGNIPMYKQVCVIPFRRGFLDKFVKMPPTALEQIESIDMLRILENGEKQKWFPLNIQLLPLILRRILHKLKY